MYCIHIPKLSITLRNDIKKDFDIAVIIISLKVMTCTSVTGESDSDLLPDVTTETTPDEVSVAWHAWMGGGR